MPRGQERRIRYVRGLDAEGRPFVLAIPLEDGGDEEGGAHGA